MTSLLIKYIETIAFAIACLFLLWFGVISDESTVFNYSIFGIIILIILYLIHMLAMAEKELKKKEKKGGKKK